MKTFLRFNSGKLLAFGLGAACLSVCLNVQGQLRLPVYLVTASGATQSQASDLAGRLNVPVGQVTLSNGQASFIDPSNFLAIPTVTVTNPAITDELLAETSNKFPSIPISFRALDFNALSNLTVINSNAAVSMVSVALAGAGLTPSSATPIVTHTYLTAFYTNGGSVISASNALDTEVDYQLTVPAGYPLVGPGAQIQFAFGTNGASTRFLYAARQLASGPMVTVISSSAAAQRAAGLFPGLNTQLNAQLVYYAPPLSIPTVSAIIPWYLCSGTAMVTNPAGLVTALDLNPVLIPATDDTNFVPTINFSAGAVNGFTQISAGASVSGGMPPYSYTWGGTSSNISTNVDGSITFTPMVRVTPPTLTIAPVAVGLVVSWYDTTGFFGLQSASNLTSAAWTSVTNPVVSGTNGFQQVTLSGGSAPATFFRLGLPGPTVPLPQTVSLAVMDNNGVVVHTNQTVPSALAEAYPAFTSVLHAPGLGWGVESPYDPGLGTMDRQDWVNGVDVSLYGNHNVFNFNFGSQTFDFQGVNDNPDGIYNEVLNTVDIVLYIGHGNPDAISFTSPYCPQPLPYYGGTGSWGTSQQEWMCFLSCEVLAYTDGSAITVDKRWGPNFNGLHLLLGFTSNAGAETGFPKQFVAGMSSGMPIQKAWFAAAKACSTGSAACLAPLGPAAICDTGDCWWGLGPVGPSLSTEKIQGWAFLTPGF